MNPTADNDDGAHVSPPAACPRCGAVLEVIGGECAACLAGNLLSLFESPAAASVSDGTPRLPGWRLTRILGAGGMGQVYHAEREETDAAGDDDATPAVAAVKILDRRWASDPVMAARLESEAETLRGLDHPGIVRLLETAETEDGRLCLVMELIDGCDLGRLLRAEKLPPERAASIFRQVCEATAHAHGRGFLHRDIKPSNILLGGGGEVKLADFGLARAAAQTDGVIGGLTATTDQFGTAYYLAPERMIPGRPVSARADVYALGVLLYHLFAGRMPLGKFTPLSRLAALPPAVDPLISRALEADPERRTPDVAALLAGFEKVWRSHLADTSRRRLLRRAAVALCALCLVGLALAAGAWWQRGRTAPPRAPFRAPETASRETPWENSLGMKFVPVPGAPVLFSVWETRRSDAADFIETWRNQLDEPWQAQMKINRQTKFRRSLSPARRAAVMDNLSVDKPKEANLPINFIFGMEAQNFARWLTWREQVEGRLAPWQYYRLPTSVEWAKAAGGGTAPDATAPANLAGPESAGQDFLSPGETPSAPEDPFAGMAPAGSFPPSPLGIHDMTGNVSEWVRDPKPYHNLVADSDSLHELVAWNFQVRGSSFADSTREAPRRKPKQRQPWIGFRLVLEHVKPPDTDHPDSP